MRVLVLTSYVPYPPNAGAKIRVSNHMRYLSREHEVVLLCPVRPGSGQAEAARQLVGEYCSAVVPVPWHKRSKIKFLPHLGRYIARGEPIGNLTFYYEELAAALHDLTARRRFDVIDVHHGYMGPYIEHIAPQSRARTVFSLHNVPYVQWWRMMLAERDPLQKLRLFRDWLFQKHATLAYVRRYDRTIVVSERDREILLRDAPQADVVAVPTGMNSDRMAVLPPPEDFRHLMLVGSMYYRPNVDAARFLAREIFPRIRARVPDARLFIIGAHPPRSVRRLGERVAGLTVTGYVDSVRPYYERACLNLVPLRAGSGIRVKILESLAWGRPVVTTTLGCEGLSVKHGEHLIIADGAEEFAAQVVRLMNDRQAWHRLAAGGRRLIEEVYDWRVVGRQLVAAFSTW